MLISVEKVSLRFGERTVLSDVDAEIRSGEITALVGPSGSGKSSLLAIMAGILKPDSGRVRVRSDVDAESSPPDASEIAWVPQGSNALGTRSVVDNVAIGALSGGASLAESLEVARSALLQVGLLPMAVQQARSLSGGELQRVAIARALASGKPAIFADEPSANLDAANTREIANLLRGLEHHTTIVVATHDPLLVDAADRVIDLRVADARR